jgi:UDP-2,3-diacylglucosamine pyrophosphatase LpxH
MVKDPHFMFGFRNNIRKHGWEKHIDSKIDQIINYAVENKIKRVIFTGDVFEKSKKADWSFNQHQQNKERLKRFKNAGIEIFSNLGNHDQFNGQETIKGTVFGEMVELNLINYLGTDKEPYVFNFSNLSHKVLLYGIDHHQSIDKIIDKLEQLKETPFSKTTSVVLTMHSNITDQQTRLTDFTYEQLANYPIDIINCGHWHLKPEGGSIQEVNNTHFLNPWNLTRVVRDYYAKLDEHKPSFIHVSIIPVGDSFDYNFKEIFLDIAPFSETFNIDIINMLQEMGKEGFKFFDEISLEQEDDINDDANLIEILAKQYSISNNSIKIAKELLT